MQFVILGPVRVTTGAETIALPPKERTVLAALLLQAGSVVSTGTLAAVLWDTDPPPAAHNTIQGYIKRLRRMLGAASGRIVTRAPGYRIEVRPGELDLHVFNELRERARAEAAAGRWERAGEVLAEALRLWHVEPLSDTSSTYLWRTEIPRLVELRTEAVEARIEADLHAGKHQAVIAELRALVAEHPLRERPRAQLMLALYRGGRQSDALAAYTDARDTLRGELGVDPGRELQELRQRILIADPALRLPETGRNQPPVPQRRPPRQLLADLADFTGREIEVSGLHEFLAGPAEDRPGPVIAITGQGGIGKTALAVHAAHQVAAGFPGGQLFIGLGGSARPMKATDALARLLRDLGVPDAAVPAAEAERAARYRTIVAERKMLIVLDDAHSAAQVRPLLPGAGGSAVVVTSRSALADLAGAALTELHVLDTGESLALFTTIAGERRAAADPGATDGILASCGGLPLAIRIAASRLVTRPNWTTAQLAALLASEQRRLGELATGDTAVRASFEVSYRALPGSLPARVFRLFGIAGLTAISLPALAALCGQPESQTSDAVETLVDTHLLESPEPGRYQAHDLLRLYAAERAATDETDDARRTAIRRLLTWYLYSLGASVERLGKQERRMRMEPLPADVTVLPAGTLDDALTWLRAEHGNLIQVVNLASREGQHTICWQLAHLLQLYFEWSGYWNDKVAVCQVGLAAAQASGDELATARLLSNVGGSYRKLGDLPLAERHLSQALALRQKLGDKQGECMALVNLGLVQLDSGKPAAAIRGFRRALTLNREIGNRIGEGYSLHNLGTLYQAYGRLERALGYFTQALEIRQELKAPHELLGTMHSMGEVLLGLGRVDEGMRHLEHVLELCRQHNMRYGEGMTLATLGDGHRSLGKLADARQAWQLAYDILSELGDSEASSVRDRLDATQTARSQK